ncbi:MAG: TIGR02186 family protein [Rhodobacteraceae bacterium]|nr:TIGR02186 family protein [Paracoccaceae bacterium]MBL6639646.1 TIGR02186 family protein [Paracoccaceae bacterium]MBL6677042.1 TIGR02186 family protein [Paracoccaceae bacterium]MBL6788767.1 TIGR02186 family protein [Paracoccaceae bacterium]MBL6860063.1 TIGR02186 family protein [Paracoccaceae bacterium]
MRLFVCSALIMLLTSPFVLAEKVVLGMSQDEVAITATFDGSNILVFGAIQRDAPIPETPIDVIVTISGPSEPLDVRRKAKRFGIWVNTDTVQVDAAPSFYAIATSAPLGDILTETEDLRHKVSINRAIRSVGAPMNILDAQSFTDAVIRIREANGLYRLQEGSVSIDQQTLFRTSINMPANLTEGDYSTRIFITRDGAVVDQLSTKIDVRKVGLERFLFSLSREQPLLYGLMSLAIAIFAGWAASAVFQVIRNR